MEDDLRFVTTPVVTELTGLSTDKLREWTSRRALVPADVRPKGKGSPAKFSWQTILVLRVAVLLRDSFGIELAAHKSAFADLRTALRSKSFIGLWGNRLALSPSGSWAFLEKGGAVPIGDFLVVELDPHLRILRGRFSLPDAAITAGQLDLFSLPNLQGRKRPQGGPTTRASTNRKSA
jgi:hypothetical protein